jgi:hypothetical protein
MKSGGIFMRSRYGLLLIALIVLGVLIFYKFRKDDTPVDTGGSELQIRGKQFRAEVDSTFLKMSKVSAQRVYDLTEVCKKYFPVGTLFSDVEVMLVAGGALPSKPHGMILVPSYNRGLPENSPDRNDVGGGFALDRSLVSNSIFVVIFRPQEASVTPRKIGQIIACFVRTTNL